MILQYCCNIRKSATLSGKCHFSYFSKCLIRSRIKGWNHIEKTKWDVIEFKKFSNFAKVNTKKRVNNNTFKLSKVSIVSKANTSSNLRRLLALAKPEKWKLVSAVGLLIVSSSVTMAVPFALGRVIDTIYNNKPEKLQENLTKLVGTLIVVFVIGALCNMGRVYFMSVAGQRITRALRHNVFKNIMRQEVAYFDRSNTGELVNRLSSDTTLVSQTITSNISDGLRSTVMVGAGISMMFFTSPELATVGLAIVPPVAAMAVIYGRFVRNITKQVQDSLASATSVAQERIANIRTVKSFNNELREIAAYKDKLNDVLKLAYRESLARGIFFGVTGLSGNVIILTVLYYGGVMVSTESLTVGSLSSFLMYAAYVGISISGLSSFYSELSKGLGATTRLWEILDRQPKLIEGQKRSLTNIRGAIAMKNVKFTYPTRPEVPILDDLNLYVPPGSIIAIVGPSGSGKSSVAAILLRLYDPDVGEITLDSVPLQEIDRNSLLSQLSFVSQEPVLFSTSIRENILYGANDPTSVTEERLHDVCREANCLHFILRDFPNGFDTLVGERGVMLSGGQKQRIAIARALIKNPKILILDEATSALDAESEHLVQEALERIMTNRTVLTIAHRLSTIKNADQIVVLDKGKIIESGTYNQLVNIEDGAFKKLIKHQAFL